MQLSKALQQSKNQKALENAPSNPSIAAFGGYGNYLTKELNVESKEREDQHIVKAPRTSLWSLVREKRPTIVDRNYPSIYPTIPMPEHALESITETNPRSQKLDPESALYAYDASLIRYNPKTGDFYLSN